MSNNNELAALKEEREIDTIWLEKYHRIVVGLAAMADCNSEGCAAEWLAMLYSLETLADMMKSDLDERKKEANNG